MDYEAIMSLSIKEQVRVCVWKYLSYVYRILCIELQVKIFWLTAVLEQEGDHAQM